MFGTLTFIILFGLLPALLRRAWRAYRTSRRRAQADVVAQPWNQGLPAPAGIAPSVHPVWTTPEGQTSVAFNAPELAWPVSASGAPSTERAPVPSAPVPSAPVPSAPFPLAQSQPDVVKPPAPSKPVAPVSLVRVPDRAESKILDEARAGYPFPIAHAVRRVQGAATSKDRYDLVLEAGEAVAATLGLVVAVALKEVGHHQPAFVELERAMTTHGATFGNWVHVIAAAKSLVNEDTEPVPGLAAAFVKGTKGSGLVSNLDVLVSERNNKSHGRGPRTSSDAEARLAVMLPALERCIERGAFLRNAPWLLVRTCGRRRGDSDFTVTAGDLMADHPDFGRRTFFSGEPLSEETVYLFTSERAIDMTPLVVMHDCPECHQEELCHADGVNRDGVILKSFARGHAMSDPTLSDEMLAFFGAPRAS